MADVYTQDCAICLETLKTPKVLPCSHLFCEVCISEYIISTANKPGQKTYNCPVCRVEIEINNPTSHNSTWVHDLPTAEGCQKNYTNRPTMQNKQQCHPCERSENVSIDATVWCSNCGEALCQKCCDLHRRFRTTTTHKTFPITTTTNDDFNFLAETNEFCSKHETKPLDVYCLDHLVPCCVVCLAVNHRTCNVKCIEELGDVKAENIELFLNELDNVKYSLNELIKSKAKNKESLNSSFKTMEKDAISTTTNLKKRIDDLCQDFIKNSSLMQDDLLTELDNVIKQAQGHTLALDNWTSRLKIVNSFGSRSQTLVAKEKIRVELANKELHFKSLLNENQDIDVSTGFKEISEALSKVEMLGKISVLKHINKISDKNNDQRNNLFKSNRVQLETLSLKFRSILGFKEKEFISGVCLNSEKCVVISSTGQCEIINIRTNQIVTSVSLSQINQPKRICYDKSSEHLFVTFNGNCGVSCEIKEDNIKQVKAHSFKKNVCGIDMFDEKLYILSTGILQTPDMQNPSVYMQSGGCGSVDDLAVDKVSGRLAFTIQSSKSVSFTTFQKRELKNTVQFKTKPVALTFGPDGILFVAERNFVSFISKNEQTLQPLIEKLEKLVQIRDIWTDKESNVLFVCGNNYIEIYDIQWG
ncbi:TRIM56 [Mytilus edulis]|uniref:TRIM56 n=1 Tax=Mytilus edulis TaxID=6550 RepID=A0A8S3TKJ0_MYTED|nr:TRIM56 [Mytilus edulis]